MTSNSPPPNDAKLGVNAIDSLLAEGPRVVNVGLEQFAVDLADQGVSVIHVDWSPPAAGDAKLRSLLTKMGS